MQRLAPSSDVVIIVDVFSFSTSVEIGVTRGAQIYPYRWHDETARHQNAGEIWGEPAWVMNDLQHAAMIVTIETGLIIGIA